MPQLASGERLARAPKPRLCGFFAGSQQCHCGAVELPARIWRISPAPAPPSFSWPLCVSPRPRSAADGACCVRRGGRNQVPCQRTSLCLPRLSLLRAVCLSLSFCLAGADPAKCVCREMMDHDAPAEMAVCGLRRDTGGGRGVV
eukprot:COSAG01_NODE_135_length_24448_cov_154.590086_13_plen_144_part_00